MSADGTVISYIRGGFWGVWAGGWAFIAPNFLIVAALGALHAFGSGLVIVPFLEKGLAQRRRDLKNSPRCPWLTDHGETAGARGFRSFPSR